MRGPAEEIEAERLCETADAVMAAVQELAEAYHGYYIYPPILMGSVLQPQCLCDFTLFEVAQATDFLVRLGLLPALREECR